MGLTRQQIIQVAALLFGCLLAELNYTLLAPALPIIMSDMSIGETDVDRRRIAASLSWPKPCPAWSA